MLDAVVCKAQRSTLVAEEEANRTEAWFKIFKPVKMRFKAFHHLSALGIESLTGIWNHNWEYVTIFNADLNLLYVLCHVLVPPVTCGF